ncbi:MAG: phenylalanine--tRNA ligase subunit alpha [Vicinamibacterales bacterium]|nr:phenylalanine--tRNA ligase subunit alpha [Vicinamibacterales bacterium]
MAIDFEQLEQGALTALARVNDSGALAHWRLAHLGKTAPVMAAMGTLGALPKDERKVFGQRANQARQAIEHAYESAAERLRQAELEQSIRAGALDVTLPGRTRSHGRLHPATQGLRRIYAIFAEMGFQIYRSRDVETDEFNFGLLNIPPHHPARDMWDTFYTTAPNVILRTHTSPGQIHVMRERCPEPIRVILPGMCYRYEQITARSEIQFYQVEGLAIGRHITMADLKGTLTGFARALFGGQVRTRFRADHFPFTEPSAEMDVECFVCGGRGCPVCKHSGWLEILGCGMVHPTVLQNGGYDPRAFSGFAFGLGPQRITMLLHKIEDIRGFFANDLRFLEQF